MASPPLRIVHATSVHRWDDGRIFERQCRSLAAAGHDVTLVAPGGDRGRVDGVDVVGIGAPSGRLSRMTHLVGAVRASVDSRRPDVVVLHDPELLRLVLAPRRRLAAGAIVYDAHEDYRAQMRDKEWLPAPVRSVAGAVLGRAEQLAAARTDLVLCATPTIAERFVAQRAHVVLNRPLLADLPPIETIETTHPTHDEPAMVCFVGDLRAVRGAHALVDAMEIVNRHRGARLAIAGRITPAALAEELSHRPGWSQVDLLGWRSRSEVYSLMARSHVAVLPFLAAENHVSSQPNKLFEYMLMGAPVAGSDFPHWRSLAAEVDAAFHPCVPGDASSIASAILAALDQRPSTDARRAAARRAREVFSWEAIESDYVDLIQSMQGWAVRRR